MKQILILFLLLVLGAPPALRAQTADTEQPADHPRWSLSTNVVQWALLAPNAGVELYLGKRWSLAADGAYAWWGLPPDDRGFRHWSVGGEVRHWLQASRYGNRRTWAGLSVRGGEYDRYFHRTGRTGDYLTAGLTAGYRFLLRGQWRIDASIGAGYVYRHYDRYFHNTRFDVWQYNGTRTRHGFGLTQAQISIVKLF